MLSERHQRHRRDHPTSSLPRHAATATNSVPPPPPPSAIPTTAAAATPSPSDSSSSAVTTRTSPRHADGTITTGTAAVQAGGGGGGEGSMIAPIPTSTVRRIVAGQAITDLPSAVKELVDNALDARARTINVRLFGQTAGVPPGADLIEVSDDGVGVPVDSRPYLATRHATSKLTSFEQLYGDSSSSSGGDARRTDGGGGGNQQRLLGGQLGFRGEALNSLASISSSLVIATRTSDEPLGQKLCFDRDGSLDTTKIESVSRKVGTTVAVMKLFDALPVRRADFLKRIRTQRAKMLKLLQSYAIFNVGVRFNLTDISTTTTGGGNSGGNKYRSESRLVTSGNSRRLEDTITSVLGAKFLSGLVRLPIVDLSHVLDSEDSDSDDDDDSDDGGGNDTEECKMEGLVSAPPAGPNSSSSAARELQFFCLNGRPVEMPKLSRVINDCWRSANPTSSSGKRPACVIKLTLPRNCFDINLAPDKREVLLTHEEETCDALRHVLSDLWGSAEGAACGNEEAFARNEVEEMAASASAVTASSSRSGGPSGSSGDGVDDGNHPSSSSSGSSLILAKMDAFRRTGDGPSAATAAVGAKRKVGTLLTSYYQPVETGEKNEDGGDDEDQRHCRQQPPRREKIDHLAREASASLAHTMSIYTPSNPLAAGLHHVVVRGGGGVGRGVVGASSPAEGGKYMSNEQRMLSRIAAAEEAEYGPTVTPEQDDESCGGEPPPPQKRGRMRRRNACINSLDNVGGYGADEESSSSAAAAAARADAEESVVGATAVSLGTMSDVASSSTARGGAAAAASAAAAVTRTPQEDGVGGASVDEADEAVIIAEKRKIPEMNGVDAGSEPEESRGPGTNCVEDEDRSTGVEGEDVGKGRSSERRKGGEVAVATKEQRRGRKRERPPPPPSRLRPDVSMLTRFALGATPGASEAATNPLDEEDEATEDDGSESESENDPDGSDHEVENDGEGEDGGDRGVGGGTAAMSADGTADGGDRPSASVSEVVGLAIPSNDVNADGVDKNESSRVEGAPIRSGPQDEDPDRGDGDAEEGKRKGTTCVLSSSASSPSTEEEETSETSVNDHVAQDEAGEEDEGQNDEEDDEPVTWDAYGGGTGSVLMRYRNSRRRTKSQYRFLRGMQSERTTRHRAAGGASAGAVLSSALKGDDTTGIGDSVGLPDDVGVDVADATPSPPSTHGREGGRKTTATKRKRKRGEVVTLTKGDFRTMTIVGQFNLGFILATDRNGHLWILDQHACDEKANFERLCATTTIHEQRLLAPLPLELSPTDEICILDHMDVFEKNGFRFTCDPDGPPRHRLALTALPHSGSGGDGRRAVQFGKEDVVALCAMLGAGGDDDVGRSGGHGGAGYGTGADGSGAFGNNAVRRYAGGTWSQHSLTMNDPEVNGSGKDGFSNSPTPGRSSSGGGARAIARLPKAIAMFASRACRHSIMIGTALSRTEMEGVVRRMHDVEQPWNCPHGRPTMRHVTDLMACLLEDEISSARHVAGPSLAILSQVEDKENDGEEEEE